MTLTIKTNHAWRYTSYGSDVPRAVMTSQFDHLVEDERADGFVRYRGYWYHVSDFMRVPAGMFGDDDTWHGYLSDSAFSGVLIRLSDDGESVMLATYFS